LSTTNIRNADTQRRDERKKACNNDETCQVGKIAGTADITYMEREAFTVHTRREMSDYRLSEGMRADQFVKVSSLVQSMHQQKRW